MIDLDVRQEQLEKTITRAREKNILIPTFEEQKHPETISEKVQNRLKKIGLWEIDPLNLFRISWKNEPTVDGGLYGKVNYIEIPSLLTGVKSRIYGLVGKWYPTGSHKVGATFGCLVPQLVTGNFDPANQRAVWPSTGNFCRGGAYTSALLGCESTAILPEEMSRERFDWLSKVAGEVIATPGSESNVKEIYDKCRELRTTRKDVVIFNQFEEFGNYLWHYTVTGQAIEEVLKEKLSALDRFAGIVIASGSAGTLACGDYLKEKYPRSRIAVAEALQCPTLLMNGYGAHRIEGIGDKHVPWIHNVRNTDMVIAVDDASCVNLIRLFNEPCGQEYLASLGLSDEGIKMLPLLGMSGVSNLIAAIKFARYYELTDRDVIFTVFTDSMEFYGSRLVELGERFGEYTRDDAVQHFHRYLMGVAVDSMLELSHYDRKRIHNLKYFTWVEQQGKDVAALDAQWNDYPHYWVAIGGQQAEIDDLIQEFNTKTGLLQDLG
ncbi:MAG: pyridoxal-phosphate dependent enzyme [Proteobacteria bacterium]|nr:pyridoxal-phosphate dependent enzyme [Pseudomonadota bacterium]